MRLTSKAAKYTIFRKSTLSKIPRAFTEKQWTYEIHRKMETDYLILLCTNAIYFYDASHLILVHCWSLLFILIHLPLSFLMKMHSINLFTQKFNVVDFDSWIVNVDGYNNFDGPIKTLYSFNLSSSFCLLLQVMFVASIIDRRIHLQIVHFARKI